MGLELSARQRELIDRRDRARANARGCERMAASFDAEAERCNAELEERA